MDISRLTSGGIYASQGQTVYGHQHSARLLVRHQEETGCGRIPESGGPEASKEAADALRGQDVLCNAKDRGSASVNAGFHSRLDYGHWHQDQSHRTASCATCGEVTQDGIWQHSTKLTEGSGCLVELEDEQSGEVSSLQAGKI